ncbi:MAG: TlpA disulfide reductase family protein [Candidatus Neomarinimicrobiota bacterium]
MLNTRKLLLLASALTILLVAGIIATEKEWSGELDASGATMNLPGSADVAGTKAPDFTLTDLEGDSVSLSDFKGKVVILNFWATWCAPCREEIPGFIDLQTKYEDDIVILGISVDEDGSEVVPRFVERFGVNYPVLYASAKVISDYGGITGIPTSFVLDRDLLIQRLYVGYRPLFMFERDIELLI